MVVSKFKQTNASLDLRSGLLTSIGNTPLLPITRIADQLPTTVKIFAKAEWFNPGGSVKDRPALNIIRTALDRGEFAGGRRLLDSTSGNMGIAYATIGAVVGISVTLVVPANASPERLGVLNALGVELILSDPLEGSDGAMLVAREMAAQYPEKYYYADQYNNPLNWQAHFHTTGPEIWEQTEGSVTHFVTGLGTTGTLTGTARYLKKKNPNIGVISFQPGSPFHGLEGLKHLPTSHQPGIFDPELADWNLDISSEHSYEMVRRLAREEGLFVGISSGAALLAALQVAGELDEGVVVTVFPDDGYKYLSNKLWEEQ